MNPLFCVLVFLFPDIFKWKRNSFDQDMELSSACLNLIHSILNTNLSNWSPLIQNSPTFYPKNTQENYRLVKKIGISFVVNI